MAGYSAIAAMLLRMGLAMLASAALLAGNVSVALAQTQNCTQITAMLRGIERNAIFINYNNNVATLRATEGQVREAESLWIRGGCQQAHTAGQALSRDCRSLAQTITAGRNQVQQLTQMAREGQSLAQNRESLLQESARFRCGAGGQSGVTIANQPGQRDALMNQIFGGGEYYGTDYIEGGYDPWSQMATRRTVCVRTCDGFYWPISFSTTDDYITQDAIKCHEMCPGTEVLLFSYRNPGEEPEDMISLSGVPYRSTPYAFAFRTAVDKTCSCQQREALGTIAMSDTGGQSRAVIDFGELSFPLPQRDPRRTVDAIVAEALFVPLPRPRPQFDGETVVPTRAATPTSGAASGLRIVNFGDRQVRVVGPETPFVPSAEGAS